jgi:DMSO/TMAO reductase YedYZ molybdopterin-dependent catalytic subunit
MSIAFAICVKREGIRPPKFADQFARLDFEAEPLPVLSLYPMPEPVPLEAVELSVCGLDLVPRIIGWADLSGLPRVQMKLPLICQIFNWSEVVEWEGIPLRAVMDHLGLDTAPKGVFAFYSRDGHYFETLARHEARDPRVLLAYGLNGAPLPAENGGPLRLVVPFLQGYKSVKWVRSIRAFRQDAMGIKKLRGQSRDAQLSEEWAKRHGMTPPDGKAEHES